MAIISPSFTTRLLDSTTIVPEHDQPKLLHHAILYEWPESSFALILAKMSDANSENVLHHENYFSVSTAEKLCFSTTPGFWMAYFSRHPGSKFAEVTKLTGLMRRFGHHLFSRKTWEYLLNCHLCSTASGIIDAFWKARCYETRMPPWFMGAVLAAGIREECLTPYHYYSAYSQPLRDIWDKNYPHSLMTLARHLRKRTLSHAGYLFDLLSMESDNVCDIRGFVNLYRIIDSESRATTYRQHPWKKDEECTALGLLGDLWDRRKRRMIPRSHEMSSSFELAIAHLKDLP